MVRDIEAARLFIDQLEMLKRKPRAISRRKRRNFETKPHDFAHGIREAMESPRLRTGEESCRSSVDEKKSNRPLNPPPLPTRIRKRNLPKKY